MTISVVIPAWNEEARIGRALECALALKVPAGSAGPIEIIVVDNASTDRTAEIVRQFAARGVHLVREDKKGTSAAREAGRRASHGDIIAYMDADCEPAPDWLEKGMAFFSNPRVIAVSGPYDYHDSSTSYRTLSLFVQMRIYTPVNRLLQTVKGGGTMVGGNSFFRASALEKIGGFNTDIVFYGDEADASRRLAKVGRIVYSPKLTMKTSARRFHNEGIATIFFKYIFYFFRGIARWE